MNVRSAAAFLLFAATPLLAPAQTGSAAAPAHRRVAHRAAAVHKPAPCPPALPAPVLPPGVPPAPGPVQTAFALRYVDITPGTGVEVQPGDSLTVHYTGWLAADGTKFDSSVDRGTPFTFQQGAHRVIPGWDEGFAGMRVGGKRRLFIPYQLAYGDQGRPPVIPAKSDLIFDIEVVADPSRETQPASPAQPPATPQAPGR